MRLRASVLVAVVGAAAFAAGLALSLHRANPVHLTVRGRSVIVRTARPSTVYVEYGPTSDLGLFAPADAPARVHRFVLPDLAPGVTYEVRAVTSDAAATTVVDGPPRLKRRSLGLVGDHFELDGHAWIPRFTWGSCSAQYGAEAAVGITAFMSSNCGDSPERQATAAARVEGVVIPAVDQADEQLQTTVGTYVKDEPDSRHVPPEELAATAREYPGARGLPVFETLSPDLANGSAYARVADAIGVDVYPILNTGDHGKIGEVASAQRKLQALAGGKPTFQWIEATGGVSARELEAEVWMALTNGARAIGYWTDARTPFSVGDRTRAAIGEIDAALDTFAPAIDATPSSLTVSDPAVNAFTTSLDGALYVFAVNTSTAATIRTSFTLAGLAGRPVAVYGGGRGPTSSGDTFADSLPPLGWRVYLVAP